MAERICVVCGKAFESKYSGAKYCSQECREGARKVQCHEAQLRYNVRQLPSATATRRDRVSEDALEAKKNGMSYGQYVARKNCW